METSRGGAAAATWMFRGETARLRYYDGHFPPGFSFNRKGWEHILNKHGGKLPLKIKAVPEGTVVPTKNARGPRARSRRPAGRGDAAACAASSAAAAPSDSECRRRCS